MISLNLISPNQQKFIRMTCIQIVIKNIVGLMIIVTIVLTIAFTPLNKKVEQQKISDQMFRESVTAQNKERRERIIYLNSRINDLKALKDEFYPWQDFLANLANLTPENVVLLDLTATHSEVHSFTLTGFTKTRDDLIKFKEDLENSGLFSNVESPLENYLSKENITFQIRGNFN